MGTACGDSAHRSVKADITDIAPSKTTSEQGSPAQIALRYPDHGVRTLGYAVLVTVTNSQYALAAFGQL